MYKQRERGRKIKGERKRGREREMFRIVILFLEDMTGALAPFS
jgi:hypothetical protein